MTNIHTKEYKCPFCGQEQTEEEMEFDEHDEPAYCFMCGARIIDQRPVNPAWETVVDAHYDFDVGW